eukprot:SAG31_NODE_19403_length_603_cov_1.023810_1_plen_107_part_01
MPQLAGSFEVMAISRRAVNLGMPAGARFCGSGRALPSNCASRSEFVHAASGGRSSSETTGVAKVAQPLPVHQGTHDLALSFSGSVSAPAFVAERQYLLPKQFSCHCV